MINQQNVWINKIHQGDNLEILKKMPSDFVDLIITSPPYFNLRVYVSKEHPDYKTQIGLEPTFKAYQDRLLLVTSELKRVLKKTGQFWLNMGDCYGGIKTGKTDRIVNDKIKEAQNGLHKNLPLQTKCLMMMPERIAIALCDQQGWLLRNKIKWAKQILDFKSKKTSGTLMPTSAIDRFNESGEEMYFFTKNKTYYSNLEAVKLPISNETLVRVQSFIKNRHDLRLGDSNLHKIDPSGKAQEGSIVIANLAKKIYNYEGQKVDKKTNKCKYQHNPDPRGDDNKGPGSWRMVLEKNKRNEEFIFEKNLTKNLPSIWKIRPEGHNFKKEYNLEIDHFATFPQALCEIPIKFGCPPNGIILDPFCGSGTACILAKKLKRNWIGIDLSKDYCRLAERRISETPATLL